jgi:hypothetical protein
MPAIQLARLKIQISKLLTFFDSPSDFILELHVIFEFYADRTRRPGQSGKPKPLIQAYNVPRQVMRRLYSDISSFVVDDPEGGIELADRLWEDSWFECRLLAINILGCLPIMDHELVVARLSRWGRSCKEDVLIDALLQDGAIKIRREMPDDFQILVEEWLSISETPLKKLGLRAIPPLVENQKFDNLPVFYRLLAPLLRESSTTLEIDLLRAIRALGRRSPQETAYFLEQNLIAPHKSGTTVIVRRSIDVFPTEVQAQLREVLRNRMRLDTQI